MMKKFHLALIFILGIVAAPGPLSAASEVVIGYANISARVSRSGSRKKKGSLPSTGSMCSRSTCPALPS
jgi:hypothetical protein